MRATKAYYSAVQQVLLRELIKAIECRLFNLRTFICTAYINMIYSSYVILVGIAAWCNKMQVCCSTYISNLVTVPVALSPSPLRNCNEHQTIPTGSFKRHGWEARFVYTHSSHASSLYTDLATTVPYRYML
jgi:hypothetical protein